MRLKSTLFEFFRHCATFLRPVLHSTKESPFWYLGHFQLAKAFFVCKVSPLKIFFITKVFFFSVDVPHLVFFSKTRHIELCFCMLSFWCTCGRTLHMYICILTIVSKCSAQHFQTKGVESYNFEGYNLKVYLQILKSIVSVFPVQSGLVLLSLQGS